MGRFDERRLQPHRHPAVSPFFCRSADLAKRGRAISLTMASVGSSSFLDSFRVIPHDDTQYEATAVSFCTLRALTAGVIAQKIAREKEPCKAEVK